MTHSNQTKIRGARAGFTLVELMLVVATISLLAVIGIPSYQRARKRSQTGVLMNELRTNADAFQIFVSETRNLPPSSPDLSIIPAGMETYLPSMSTWTTQLPGGGFWYWVSVTPPAEIWGFTGLIGVYNPSFTPEQLDQIDSTMDDGNANTGGIRSSTNGWVFLGVK
jgi:prepilin-type N-terminal cleavage/methylation domain-containing protein